MKREIVLVSVQDGSEVFTHMPDSSGRYATLCGMDGDDPDPSVQQLVIPSTRRKITCVACYSLWREAQLYTKSDFEISDIDDDPASY